MGVLKRLVDFLAPAGLVLAVGAVAWIRTGRPLYGGLRPWLIAAAALVLLHLVLRWEDLARGLGRRQLKYGTNTLVYVATVLAILAGLNWIASRRTLRLDLTKDRRFSLSDQTRKVVSGLKDDVKILYFQRSGETVQGQDRLKEYGLLSKHIKVDFVDPERNPTVAIANEALGPYPILVLERGARRERITNDSEQDITNALVKVTREGSKVVCLVEGSGERAGGDSGAYGFSGAKALLTRSQYEVKSVFLLREQKVPADCTVLVEAGPEADPPAEVTGAIRDFVKAGGRALVMVEPELKKPYPNLVALLKEWNLEAGNDLLVDRQGYRSPLAPLVIDYPYHEITKDLARTQTGTVFAEARSIEPGKGSPEGVSAQALVRTSAQSWAKPDPANNPPKTLEDVQYDAKADRMGPIGLAAVATLRAPSPTPTPNPSPAAEETKPREGRVVAFGDADFAANRLLGFDGNVDLFLNAIAWLTEESDLISIRPKDPENQTLFLTGTVRQNVGWMALVVIPGFFVVLGVMAWWRRR